MGLFSAIVEIGKALDLDKPEEPKKLTKEERELEKEMDLYDLDEEERELVRKGEYDPWNFDRPGQGEELDEEDYYYEDDEDNF